MPGVSVTHDATKSRCAGLTAGITCRMFARLLLVVTLVAALLSPLTSQQDPKIVRVFVFAGQSNMEGADADPAEIAKYPPFAELAEPQPKVRYWYVIGREDKQRSRGWEELKPVGSTVGPELAFGRDVAAATKAKVAIIKVAAGGTTLATDWNPDQPGGFALYPLALATVREALAALDAQHVKWRLEGFVWHQGENDMFDDAARQAYARNLTRFVACWRRDLDAPRLRFQLGELCTKTIWGMDNRMPMYGIAEAQQQVAAADPLVDYVRTSHVAVKVGHPEGLHYHYGTLGQLEHGVEHAKSYLRAVGAGTEPSRPLGSWPYAKDAAVDLYVLCGHRNMEGERAFTAHLADLKAGKSLLPNQAGVAFRYATGGGVHVSEEWEPLGPAGLYGTFGPELSFARALTKAKAAPFAIAKFTHSGSQIVDWTPGGSEAKGRNLHTAFVGFVRKALADLEQRGQRVRLAGIVYHLGENDMAFGPYRRQAAKHLGELVAGTRSELGLPELRWFVSQQAPLDHGGLAGIDVTADVKALAAKDPNLVLVDAFDPPPQAEQLVFDAKGVVWLGERLAAAVVRTAR